MSLVSVVLCLVYILCTNMSLAQVLPWAMAVLVSHLERKDRHHTSLSDLEQDAYKYIRILVQVGTLTVSCLDSL